MRTFGLWPTALAFLATNASAQALPAPSPTPMRIDWQSDPILALGRTEASAESFRSVIEAAIKRHPSLIVSEAEADEAQAALRQARAERLPTADLSVSSYRVIARDFSNDPGSILERARPSRRTDALASVTQTLFDFGAGRGRTRAASARLRAASANADGSADRIALDAIAAWYDVFAYRALVALSEAYLESSEDLLRKVGERITLGASAEGDAATIESTIATARGQLAQYRRQLANAEARYFALAGISAPPSLERAPVPPIDFADQGAVERAAADAPAVRSADAIAAGAREDAKAARADRLPQIALGVDAGRYGVLDDVRDYDIRGQVTLRQRLGGGVKARADQSVARARAARARADLTRAEAARDAVIAWTDVNALELQKTALEAAYTAGRKSRDVLYARFEADRGTLFDVSNAEQALYGSAAAYIEGLAELDAARYVLLYRSGRLLSTIGIKRDAFQARN